MRFKNFALKELLTTSTGLPNFPETWEQIENLQRLAGFLQCVRVEIVVEREIAVHAGFLRITFLSK